MVGAAHGEVLGLFCALYNIHGSRPAKELASQAVGARDDESTRLQAVGCVVLRCCSMAMSQGQVPISADSRWCLSWPWAGTALAVGRSALARSRCETERRGSACQGLTRCMQERMPDRETATTLHRWGPSPPALLLRTLRCAAMLRCAKLARWPQTHSNGAHLSSD